MFSILVWLTLVSKLDDEAARNSGRLFDVSRSRVDGNAGGKDRDASIDAFNKLGN